MGNEEHKKFQKGRDHEDMWRHVSIFLEINDLILDMFIKLNGVYYVTYEIFYKHYHYLIGSNIHTSREALEYLKGFCRYLDEKKWIENQEDVDFGFNVELFDTSLTKFKGSKEDILFRLDAYTPKIYTIMEYIPTIKLPDMIPDELTFDESHYINDSDIYMDDMTWRDYRISKHKKIKQNFEIWQNKFEKYTNDINKNRQKNLEYFKRFESKTIDSNYESLRKRILLHLRQNELFPKLIEKYNVSCDVEAKVVIIEICPINLDYNFFKLQGRHYEKKIITKNEKEKILQKFLKFISIRSGYATGLIIANSDIQLICINVKQRWFDDALGGEEEGITTSLQINKNEISKINFEKIDIEKSFKHFKGINTPSYSSPGKVRPIFQLNKDDSRIISTVDVLSDLKENQNLALMEWEDFEHLVAQLFELEFSEDGSEVKVTQSSRDKGVDAIVFDPNPLKGGKYILQAKRYTNVVGVSAVRDLYGTIMNEGANRGILITTSSYGPDAYEFAKNKPISLVDGPNLINLLNKHKMKYKIDLIEAREILDSKKAN